MVRQQRIDSAQQEAEAEAQRSAAPEKSAPLSKEAEEIRRRTLEAAMRMTDSSGAPPERIDNTPAAGPKMTESQMRVERERQQHKAEARERKKEKESKEQSAKTNRLNMGGWKRQKDKLAGGRKGNASSSTASKGSRNI